MSAAFSGGVAFSYLPAKSVQGEFGLITIGSDGTVTTNNDYTLLKAQYAQASGPDTPSQANAGNPNYPSCPPTSSAFVASTNLPPTPNESACNCIENNLSCRYTPVSSNYTAVVGSLLDTACSFLGQKGASCNDIGGDGQAGTYGRLSGCDPSELFIGYLSGLCLTSS
jgi:1,3-beta-glucanosyltransferase GAS1